MVLLKYIFKSMKGIDYYVNIMYHGTWANQDDPLKITN